MKEGDKIYILNNVAYTICIIQLLDMGRSRKIWFKKYDFIELKKLRNIQWDDRDLAIMKKDFRMTITMFKICMTKYEHNNW